ncbi:unnamed protein product [Thlaspi arvense]|uniref:Conserved oligomeric Golgi complex subunit 6 n=1 Tax=Thlaspi arvense TaxID=13288 RepID=A0AAU9R6P3_THLAR|nr:unnamed protein product [Thlaspi arvense]
MASTVGLAPGLSRKLKKVLECRTDSPDLVASLNALSSFYDENSAHARRNLRSTIEKRALQINSEFLSAADSTQIALDRVEEEVNALADCCDKIAAALSSSAATTSDIISTTERLKQELDVTTQRQEIVNCFLRDYQLSNEEIKALREDELNENFFQALSHVQEIHSNCKLLLRTHHQRAGLELMDMMAVYQEGAYERLCRAPYELCQIIQVGNLRHNALFRRFISALTRGGPGGMPRPIEVHAHDPLRYVGDMLGWLHQALASERELVHALFDVDSADHKSTAKNTAENNSLKAAESDFTFVLDRIFEGVCRPFKVRVEQVLQSQPSLINSYKLTNTLEFYSYTISDLLGRDTALCNTIAMVKNAAQKTFFDILKTRGEKLLRYPPPVAIDLSPPPAVREGISLTLEIIENYNSMMVSASGEKPAFDPVLSALLDPIIKMCEQAAEAHKSYKSKMSGQLSRRSRSSTDSNQLTSVDALLSSSPSPPQNNETPSKIFLINCLCAIQQPLLRHDVASQYVTNIGSMIENHINLLVQKEVDTLLQRCGLSDKMQIFRTSTSTELPLSEQQDTSPATLSECLKAFFGLVLGSEGSLPEFEQIQVPKLRSEACVRVAKTLAEAYEVIYRAVMDQQNGYSDPKSLARHPPDQIRTILGI